MCVRLVPAEHTLQPAGIVEQNEGQHVRDGLGVESVLFAHLSPVSAPLYGQCPCNMQSVTLSVCVRGQYRVWVCERVSERVSQQQPQSFS